MAPRTTIRQPDDPWLVDEGDFPESGGFVARWQFLLNYAVLAPSSHNTQPWLFKVRGPELLFFADRRQALPVTDPHDRALLIACGAALFNLRVAAAYFGCQLHVTTFPDFENPDLMAVVRMDPSSGGPTGDEGLAELFPAIKTRRTNRNPYRPQPIEPEVIFRLVQAAEAEGARLFPIADTKEKQKLIELVVEGDRIQCQNGSFRRELAAWIHPERKRSRDGMPAYADLIPLLASYLGPYEVRNVKFANGKASQDRELAQASPGLLVLTTKQDNGVNWFACGQALERVLLTAGVSGLASAYLNQPVEVDILREDVVRIIGVSEHPQLILRVGYAESVIPSPRRPVESVLIS